MILVDTNTWIAHLRQADARLSRYLRENRVVSCDVVQGELLLGSGLPRAIEDLMALLPSVPTPTSGETVGFVRRNIAAFRGSGVGWADTQIIAAAASSGARLYSSDRAVQTVWRKLGFRLA